MKYLLLLLIPFSAYSQDISIHLNTRNAKESNIFDYWIGGEIDYLYDSSFRINIGANFERDDSVNYNSYKFSITNYYWKVKFFEDTEKDIRYSSLALYYPIWYLKTGLETIYSDGFIINPYLSFTYKFINFDFSYHKNKTKIEYRINPKLFSKEQYSLKLNIEGLYFDKKCKWKNELTFNYEF